MKICSVRASSWPGELVLTLRCSKCGTLVRCHKNRFCEHCGHQFNRRPERLSGTKAAEIIDAHYMAKEGNVR